VTEFVVERTITFHITTFSERATFITSLCFENRFGLGTIETQNESHEFCGRGKES